MPQGVSRFGWALGAGLAMAILLAAPAGAATRVYEDQAQILKAFPHDFALTSEGVNIHLKSGDWVEMFANPFGPDHPVLCWYAPALHLVGVCQSGQGKTLTVLFDTVGGHRLSAPGRMRPTPDPTLFAIGPDEAHGAPSESLTLARAASGDIIDEGGADFDETTGPGAWVDAGCYQLRALKPGGGGWLEKTAKGWIQVTDAQSTVCGRRHAH